MELAFSFGLAPRSPGAVLLGGFLGLAAGIAIGLSTGGPTVVEKAFTDGFVGACAGLGTVLIVWRRSAPAAPR